MKILKEIKAGNRALDLFDLKPFTIVRMDNDIIVIVIDQLPEHDDVVGNNIITPYCWNKKQIDIVPLYVSTLQFKWMYLVTKILDEEKIEYKDNTWYYISSEILNRISDKKEAQLLFLENMDFKKSFDFNSFISVEVDII